MALTGQGFPPLAGGGGSSGGGGGGSTFDPLDITIDAITVSGVTATVKYTLPADYTPHFDATDPPYMLLTGGGSGDVFDVENNLTQQQYTENVTLPQANGSFHVFVRYEVDGNEFKGVGRSFTVEDGAVTDIGNYITYLGRSPLTFAPRPDFCPSCPQFTRSRGASQKPHIVAGITQTRVPLLYTSGASQGCPDCGASGADGSGIGFQPTLLAQWHSTAEPGSAGVGMHLPFVKPMYLVADDDGENVSVRYYDPELGSALTLRDDYNAAADDFTGTVDGILESKYALFSSIKLSDGSSTVTKLVDATEIHLTQSDGTLLKFEIWDIDQSGGDQDQDRDAHGRLKEVISRCGKQILLMAYTGNTGYPDSVTDRYGNVMTLSFGATVAGRKALSSITYNGQVTSISYANDFINEITYPGGAKWTCGLSYDSASQTDMLTIESPCDGKKYYRLTADFMIYNDDIVNQPINVLRAISDSNDDNLMSIFFNPNDASEARIWTAGDRLALYHDDEFARYLRHYKTWTLGNIDDGWDAFTNLTLESSYASHNYSPITGGTDLALAFGAAPTVFHSLAA